MTRAVVPVDRELAQLAKDVAHSLDRFQYSYVEEALLLKILADTMKVHPIVRERIEQYIERHKKGETEP